jgi:DNA-binding NarL/FixJ family response regulator
VPASVLIVDDHPSFRASARRLLEADGWDVIGEAGDAAGAIAAARRLRPSLVLLDVNLPDGDGYEVASALTAGEAPPAVVLTSTHESADIEPLARASGARGFVPKHELSSEALASFLA